MNLIDRYVYAVTKGLPQKQREDIEKELKTLIDDMLEQYQGDEPIDKKVEKVLLELGDPELMADNYRESNRYLISPRNFENYVFILKIVMGAVFLGISISTVVESFFSVQEGAIGILVSYLAILFSALMQAFSWVTIIFAIAEHYGVKLLDKKNIKEGWSIAELPELPQKEAAISKGETVFSILFSTIFISILCFAPQIFAAYLNIDSGNTRVIPVFNIEVLSQFKLFFVGIFILGIIKETLKLYCGRWSLRLAVPLTFLSIASAIITVSIFANPNIWNTNFSMEIIKYLDMNIEPISLWNSLHLGFLIVLIFAFILEITTSLYKGIKYKI